MQKRESSPLIPRNIKFDLEQNPIRLWFDSDFNKTAFCDVLSVYLPAGERFFIRSIRHYLDQIDDPGLLKEVEDFIAQESFHTREHEGYNRAVASLGYDMDRMEKRAKHSLNVIKHPLHKLAVTCAIEHLTATFSDVVLNDPTFFDGAEPAYRDLWFWHALEETEHKGVAYDVYLVATKDMPAWKRYFIRIGAMLVVSLILNTSMYRNLKVYAENEGIAPGFRFYLKHLNVLFINHGIYRRGIRYYLKYYIPGFHPWNIDNMALIDTWRKKFTDTKQPDENAISNKG